MTIEAFEKLDLPDNPGVYFWKHGKGILYIGKATSLRDRVRSYFSADLISTRGPRMVDMVFKSDSIEWMETDSVLEAMIAEANLIKKHWPDYNVKEKDDRSWNYVVITRETPPRVLTIRGRTLDVERQKKTLKVRKSFGPFTSGSALREALKIIRRMFPYIDRYSSTKYTAGFYRQLGLAPETASGEALAEYKKNIDRIILFFEGKKRVLIRSLEREMDAAAKKLEFEKASELKRKIFALEHIQDVALIKEDVTAYEKERNGAPEYHMDGARSSDARPVDPTYRIEAYDVAHMSGKETVGVMTVVSDGEPDKNEYRRFKLNPETGNNDTANLREIIERRLNHSEWRMPDIMVIDGGQGQLNAATEAARKRGFMGSIVSVVKNDKHKPVGVMTGPDAGLGIDALVLTHKKAMLLANAEAHRFAIAYHRKLRRMRNPKRGKL